VATDKQKQAQVNKFRSFYGLEPKTSLDAQAGCCRWKARRIVTTTAPVNSAGEGRRHQKSYWLNRQERQAAQAATEILVSVEAS
jgi:hypothetical protein